MRSNSSRINLLVSTSSKASSGFEWIVLLKLFNHSTVSGRRASPNTASFVHTSPSVDGIKGDPVVLLFLWLDDEGLKLGPLVQLLQLGSKNDLSFSVVVIGSAKGIMELKVNITTTMENIIKRSLWKFIFFTWKRKQEQQEQQRELCRRRKWWERIWARGDKRGKG